ncbi:MAG: 3-oxoacyl-[acyl-carrier-protein] reductase [Ignavibacteriaceae bacterium]|nr:MAG: 3-oxoacyl-[acyl-carrier-protein] reductase [Ignavibacteriaceae bacterium]
MDKKALVTGGTRGIGKAIVEELAANGCSVVFTYQSSDDAAKAIQDEHAAAGRKVLAFKADAASFEDAQKAIDFTLQNLGGCDILVNNAGINRDKFLMMMKESDFTEVIDANLKSVFNYTKAALKPMMSNRFGRIINITSVVGLTGNAGQANYAASKAGMIGFTKSVAKEMAARNITCNAIAPGFIRTDMTDKLKDEIKDAILSHIPLKVFGEPGHIAKTVVFLASPAADYITGQVIAVDGGMTM